MKHKNQAIPKSCALCAHASLHPIEDAKKTPPLLFLLTADGMDEECVHIVCQYKKDASPTFSCHRFCFDPLKYRSKKAPALGTLDEDALLLD